jgi:hypothetical protein
MIKKSLLEIKQMILKNQINIILMKVIQNHLKYIKKKIEN